MINKDQLDELQRIFDDRYVKKTECDAHQGDIYTKINAILVENAKNATKLNLIIGILSVIGTAICAAVVKILFGG